MRPLVDTHAHLTDPQFGSPADVVAAIDRARAAGIGAIITVGVDLPSSRACVELAERYADVWATVGIHPHDATTCTIEAMGELATLARHPRVVAVGEIGLDYYRDRSPRPVQRQALDAQLTLAADIGLPVVIHNREARADLWQILEAWTVRRQAVGVVDPGVLHCFSGDVSFAREVQAAGWCISFAGPLTYRRAGELLDVATRADLTRTLVETDSPYLAPASVPGSNRRRRNEPAHVREVAERLAEIRGAELAEVADATTVAAERLFRIRVGPVQSAAKLCKVMVGRATRPDGTDQK
ncbi:MAG: TatD family hydrolase [Chloroflexi bacterium]|nr:TatD family hydrolase [Chloroflexota bacterium]